MLKLVIDTDDFVVTLPVNTAEAAEQIAHNMFRGGLQCSPDLVRPKVLRRRLGKDVRFLFIPPLAIRSGRLVGEEPSAEVSE